jgi:hypothetical protein
MACGTDLASVERMNPQSLMVPVLAAAVLAAALFLPTRSNGQAGADDPALALVVNDVTLQQETIIDNQAKIDAKLVKIAESLRLARIYAGRAGGKTP